MAFPYLDEANWETNTVADEWTTETDTDSKLSIKHYRELAGMGLAPYRGAYCPMIDLSLGVTNAAVYTETGEASTGDLDTAAGGTIYCSGYLYVTGLSGLAASDSIRHFVLDSAGPVVEVVVDIFNNAGTYQLRCGDGTTMRATTLTQNKWIHWEFKAVIDSGGGNDGTIDFYVDGNQIGAQITGCDQAAITQARLGFINNTVAAGTVGKILFDRFIADDARIYPDNERFPESVVLTKTQHVFVGPGTIDAAALVSETDDNQILLYDTDTAQSGAGLDWTAMLNFEAITSISGPLNFKRGCYAVLSGTNPLGQVVLSTGNANRPGLRGPLYYSDWGYKYLGSH